MTKSALNMAVKIAFNRTELEEAVQKAILLSDELGG